MLRVLFSAAFLVLLTVSSFAGTNPARQYEQQRNSEPPPDGVWYVYDRDGNLSKEEHYKNYRLAGEVKTFYPSGAIKEHTMYVDGRRDGPEKVYYQKGGIKEENFYKENNLTGTARHYYESGALKAEYTYDAGQLDGTTKEYFENGAMKQVMTYRAGVINGSILTYNEEGQITTEDGYQNGELVAHKDYSQDGASFVSGPKKEIVKAGGDTSTVPPLSPPKNTPTAETPKEPAKESLSPPKT